MWTQPKRSEDSQKIRAEVFNKIFKEKRQNKIKMQLFFHDAREKKNPDKHKLDMCDFLDDLKYSRFSPALFYAKKRTVISKSKKTVHV